MIINLLLFLTFSQQQHHHHRKVVRTLGPHTQRFVSSQGKLLNFKYFSPRLEIFVHNFLQQFVCAYSLSPSYDYKVNDVRKVGNHIALDSTWDRTQKLLDEGEKKTFGKILRKFVWIKRDLTGKLWKVNGEKISLGLNRMKKNCVEYYAKYFFVFCGK